MKVYEIILQQIGGHKRLVSFLGAKNFVYSESDKDGYWLSFRLPNRLSKDGINYIKIELNIGLDVYEMEFGKVGKTSYKVVKKLDVVYCDQLVDLIEENTGLYLSF